MGWAPVNRPLNARAQTPLHRAEDLVSADSMMDMYHKFVKLTPAEIEPYIESITVEPLSDDLNSISGKVYNRTGFSINFPKLVLNVPTLVISP